MIPHPKLHGVKGRQKYDKLQLFAVFNYFPEDGCCYSSPLLIYLRNGLKNNFGLYTAENITKLVLPGQIRKAIELVAIACP